MRLSELVGSEVRDGNRRVIGSVREVRLVQDGPEIEGFGPAFRIQGVLVGGRPSLRLGTARPDVKGPWVFKVIDRRIEQRLRFIDWAQTGSFSPGTLEIRMAEPS